MASEQNDGRPQLNRLRSSISGSEYEPLLPDAIERSLYKTISQTSLVSSHSVDEESQPAEPARKSAGVYATLSVLLLGVFISQTDHSFVLATYGAVSSSFNDAEAGSWLVSAFILAQCVAQPLYGKLVRCLRFSVMIIVAISTTSARVFADSNQSDIYGRKACLQTSYILFTVGTAISGLGRSMGQVIVGRAVQGAGGAGMVSMVAIVLTDLVPLNEVATLWSYVNILQTTGRSCGGVIGGYLTETLGWRWAFLIQCPPVILGSLLLQWQLKLPRKADDLDRSTWEKLKRVDFIGAIFLSFTIFSACFVIDVGGQKLPWSSPTLIGIIVGGAISAVFFVFSSKRSPEPIFPLSLLAHYDLVTNYMTVLLQVTVQMSLMTSVPLFFQAIKLATTGQAGAHLIPAFVGNALGGLAAGYWTRRTGLFKFPLVASPLLSICCVLLCLTWDENTNAFHSLFIFPGGFAIGMLSTSAFVAIAAAVPDQIAIAGSGMYFFFNVGAIAGISAGSAVYQSTLRSSLETALRHVKDGEMIRKRLLENVLYMRTLSLELRHQVTPAYVKSFHHVMYMGLICAGTSLIVAIFSRGRRLSGKTSTEGDEE